MRLEIYGHGRPNLNVAASLNNLGNVYEGLGKLDKAFEKHEQCLEMYLAIHVYDKAHPHIAMSLNNLGCVYE